VPITDATRNQSEGRMNPAVSLWNLIHEDRIFRWATYAAIVVMWFAIAWVEVRFLGGLLLISVVYWWLRRQRARRGWLVEREIDVDLL
jgi:hypothetical protein